jgi:glycine/D-amino acid oxidase-like deaminating enzyme
VSANADVAIVGGGIIGCALAAFLAEDGARVRLYERDEVAAGASGRNSGLLQHPMDEALTDIFAVSEALYAELGHGFELPPETVGVLVVGEDAAALEPIRAEIAGRFPELASEPLDAPHEARARARRGPRRLPPQHRPRGPARLRHPCLRRPCPRGRRGDPRRRAGHPDDRGRPRRRGPHA